MTVCPFCKSPVPSSSAKCPRCGRLASDHPSIAAIGGRNLSTDFDDDDDGIPDLARGSSVGAQAASHVSSYEASNTTFDDDLMSDAPPAGGALELDMPPMPTAPAAPELPAPEPPPQAHVQAPPSVDPKRVPPPPESAPKPPPPPPSKPDAAAIIARYPDPPEPNKIWLMPIYACKVVMRQFELRMNLTSLRRRRSPDVGLYERALKVYEPRSFFIGLAITGVLFALASFVFFLPVILRFARAPD